MFIQDITNDETYFYLVNTCYIQNCYEVFLIRNMHVLHDIYCCTTSLCKRIETNNNPSNNKTTKDQIEMDHN